MKKEPVDTRCRLLEFENLEKKKIETLVQSWKFIAYNQGSVTQSSRKLCNYVFCLGLGFSGCFCMYPLIPYCFLRYHITDNLGFPGSSVVKNSPAMQETWFLSLGWEDSLEKEMATQSSILALEIPWTEEPGGLLSIGWQKSWTQLSNWLNSNSEVKWSCSVMSDSLWPYGL